MLAPAREHEEADVDDDRQHADTSPWQPPADPMPFTGALFGSGLTPARSNDGWRASDPPKSTRQLLWPVASLVLLGILAVVFLH